MSANIMVSGLQTGKERGLKESLAAFRKHHTEVGDALRNVSGIATVATEDGRLVNGAPIDPEDPRPAYNPAKHPFPRMIYHAEKGSKIVSTDAEYKEAIKGGWRNEQFLKPQVAVFDPATEKKQMQATLAQKDGQINALNDTLQKALARLEALEGKVA